MQRCMIAPKQPPVKHVNIQELPICEHTKMWDCTKTNTHEAREHIKLPICEHAKMWDCTKTITHETSEHIRTAHL